MSGTPQPSRKDFAGEPGSAVPCSGAPERGCPPNNLPLRLTGLVGRGPEIAGVEALLEVHRLLTLIGPGGSDKTRLALAVADEVLECYEDGAWLVELASLSEPELVPQAVARFWGLERRREARSPRGWQSISQARSCS